MFPRGMEKQQFPLLDQEYYKQVYVRKVCVTKTTCKIVHANTSVNGEHNRSHISQMQNTFQLKMFSSDGRRYNKQNIFTAAIEQVQPSFLCPTCGIESTDVICNGNHDFVIFDNTCDQCGASFSLAITLMDHMKTCVYRLASLEQYSKPDEPAYLVEADFMDSSNQVNNLDFQEMGRDGENHEENILDWDSSIELAFLGNGPGYDESISMDEIFNDDNIVSKKAGDQLKGSPISQMMVDLPFSPKSNPSKINQKVDSVSFQMSRSNAGVEQVDNSRRYLLCPICNTEIMRLKDLAAHYRSHGDLPLFKCQFCVRSYNRPYWFIAHLKNVHSDRFPLECTFCNSVFLKERDFENHLRISHKLSSNDIEKQMNSMAQDCYYMCNECGRWMKSEKQRNLHVKGHQMVKGNVVQSSTAKCQNPIYSNQSKKDRKPIHIFECNICSATIKSIEEVRTHLAAHAESRLYKCEVCGERFATSTLLQRHQCPKLASAQVEHKCPQCEKVFSYAAGLACHLKTHTDSKLVTFQCDKCVLKFKRLSNYLIHRAKSH